MLLAASSASVLAETCMVSPTSRQEVSGRFGKFRGGGGSGTYGSGNSKPHMHDGLDFSTGGSSAPLFATTAGRVTYARLRGSAGNTVMIKRDSGELVVYYHMLVISVKEGDTVTAGQPIGRSGNTGMKPNGAIHLHFIYGVPNPGDARATSFSVDAAKNPAFNPAQLPNAVKLRDFGYATDPSPHFCQTFPIQGDGLGSVLGTDTKTQYSRIFGATPPMGVPPAAQFDATQVASANGDALQAQAQGATSIAGALSDTDGFGALPSAPLGNYETLSPAEMLATEARRRFSDTEWNNNVVLVSTRALWVDYLRALGVSTYLNEAVRQKKERVEALMAVYTSQKLKGMQARVVSAQERATRDIVGQSIQ